MPRNKKSRQEMMLEQDGESPLKVMETTHDCFD